MWRLALLEIYSKGEQFPTEGTPADWVEEQSVAWCDAEWRDVVLKVGLVEFLRWKVAWWMEQVRYWMADHSKLVVTCPSDTHVADDPLTYRDLLKTLEYLRRNGTNVGIGDFWQEEEE